MKRPRYWMTRTAKAQYRKVIIDTNEKWGLDQADKYHKALVRRLKYIAENYKKLHSAHREYLAKETAFSIHLVEHHYVVFQEHDKNTVIIAGIFHESMDIPVRVKELQGLTRNEIDILKREIAHNNRD